VIRRLVPLLALLALPGAAQGHIGLEPSALDVIHPPGAALPLDLESTFALFRSDDGERWSFTCHEALLAAPDEPSTQLPRYVRTADALVVALRSVGLGFTAGVDVYRSTDGGCDWDPATGLDGHTIADLTVLADGVTVLAASSSGPGGQGLYVSTDGGATFTPSDVVDDPAVFLSVAAGPGEVAWATSVAGAGPAVWRSEDAGATWVSWTPDLGEDVGTLEDFTLPMAHPTNAQTAWIRAATASFDHILRTTDAQAFTEVLRDTRTVEDGTVCGGSVVLAVEGGLPAVSDDGGASFTDADWPFAQGATCAGGELFLALSQLETDALATVSDGAAGGVFSYGEVTSELACPAGSRHAAICSPLWPTADDVLDRFRADDDDAADDDDTTDPPGCGCAASSGSPAAALLVLPWFVRRRRG